MFCYDCENRGEYFKPEKQHYEHDTSKTPTWKAPKCLKQIEDKYGI